MRNVIVMMSVSLDGFIEGPNGELDWHMVDDELHSHFNDVLRTRLQLLRANHRHRVTHTRR